MAERPTHEPDHDPSLGEYRRKRDFSRTAEPRGGTADASASGRLFVVQKHAARNLHYDLRLEFGGVLKSWAVPRGPSLDPTQKPLAVLVEDHPLEYAMFEGIIPEGEYGGGTVLLWDVGEWEPIGDPVEGFARGDFKFRLHGHKLRGAWVLARMTGKAAEQGRNWLLIKKRDDAARPIASYNVLAELPRSVASDRTLDEIAADPERVWTDGREQTPDGAAVASPTGLVRPPAHDPSTLPRARAATMPDALAPQLATPAAAPPDGDDWLHEIKLDGYRLLAHVRDGAVRLLTRNGHDWTDRFGAVATAVARLPVREAIFDGEVVVLDANGISDFSALQNAFRGYGRRAFTYYLFDLPFVDGCDLRRAALRDRKACLERIVRGAPLAAPTVQYCEHIVGRGPIVYAEAARAGLEGIIAKRADASYESRRSSAWLKIKCTLRQEFVVGGFTDPSGTRSGFGALLLGHHDPHGALVYCGRVGTGFTTRQLDEIAEVLRPLERADAPFTNPDADPDWRTVHWVAPELVVDVEFTAWTGDDLVRHATFRGLRMDKTAAEVEREPSPDAPEAAPSSVPEADPEPASEPVARGRVVRTPRAPGDAEVAGIRISHPERTVYPDDGVTKVEVARYYEHVAPWMLPYVAGRPLSLVRCPLGLAGESFFQRHLADGFPDAVRAVEIGTGKDAERGLVIDDARGLVALAQMGVLEIHTWGCRLDQVERPDHLVLDLDPGPGLTWADIAAGAAAVREYLDHVGLRSFVKTSGGKGLHVVIPIVRRLSWDDAKGFTKAIADRLVEMAPLNFVATMTKSLRRQRIFIDYLRNHLGSTSVAPYSTRARNGAHVSAPIAWEELAAGAAPSDFTVRTMAPRLASTPDPWADFADARQTVTKAMRARVGMR
ncbi:MAG: DNA ligase D [Phycisphaerales bacterium]|nr:DNA ligase D [Phycisphaerales bacterium]